MSRDETRDPAARSRRSKRRTALTAGIVGLPLAGAAFIVPALADTGQAIASTAPAAAPAITVAAPVVAPAQAAQTAEQAFYAAGYSAYDAQALAGTWGLDSPEAAIAEAGGYLLAGTALVDSPRASLDAVDGLPDDFLAQRFRDWGYTEQDGAELATRWGIDAAAAEVRAGSELKSVGVLPFVDESTSDYVYSDEGQASAAFFDAGYDYADAELLASFWGLPDPYDGKIQAGELLRTGQPLPEVDGVEPNA